MKVLFIGDSIIRGTTGVNWVKQLTRQHPSWQVINAGADGETLVKILQRLKDLLQKDAGFDYVVFEGGANDILIPYLPVKGTFFGAASKHLLKKGYAPRQTVEEFEAAYLEAISFVRQKTNAKIVLLTLGRINENANFILNEKRQEVNRVIRKLAKRHGCLLADAGSRIDAYLQHRRAGNYFLENFFQVAWFDKWQCRLFDRADCISAERGLLVTIDGLHLNTIGAAIFKEETERQLLL